MSQLVLDLSTAIKTVIRMHRLPSLLTMGPMQATGTEIERAVAARGNGNGIGMIKMIKMMTESHERGERARVTMVGKGRRSEDDSSSVPLSICYVQYTSQGLKGFEF